jgi:hypothetical protein
MTRSISSLFLEIKIDTDVIRKYLGMPIILQLSEDIEQENEGDTFCGILTDVENNQIYMEKTSCLDEEDSRWIEWGNNFMRLDPTREDPTALEESAKLRLENIQFIYICKEKATLEQVQGMFVNPR